MWSFTVESATPTIDCIDGFGRRIGTNADFTTSICSSSELSDSLISIDVFILIASLCAEDGGLEDDGREDVGDSLNEFKCSGIWIDIGVDSEEIFKLWWIWWIGRPFVTPRKLAKSYGKNGFFTKNSGWANGWNGDGKYGFDAERTAVPGWGIIAVVVCDVRIVGCDVAIVCIGLNSFAIVGGKAVTGIGPDNVGETTN